MKTQQCAVVAQRKPEVPYQLVWDNRFCAFFPFDLGLTGHTWPASCRWWRGQSPRDTLERYLSEAFPVGVKPISVSPRLFPPEKKKKNDVKSGWLVTSMSCSWEWKAYLNSHILGGVKFSTPCSLLELWELKIGRQIIFDLIMRKGFSLIDNTVLTTTALNGTSDIFKSWNFIILLYYFLPRPPWADWIHLLSLSHII